jgi:hypothetical protein
VVQRGTSKPQIKARAGNALIDCACCVGSYYLFVLYILVAGVFGEIGYV